ncbi:MAG TPA: acyltransferase family protein [Rubrobacteraceae bacterium]|nr:acyltransferase family protein [Rubrobacteraceae bacterium]
MPGLDGLRALAVIAVLLYHAGLPWIPGGFLGVEVFFVISGYLITALLLTEWRTKGSVDVKAFWMRRARRLLPALYLLIVATLAYAVVFLPGEVAGLRGDVLAALGYVTNWYLVLGQESYFEAVGRPSLLKHLWSLAVEEQFYLLWPLVFWFGVSFGATRWRTRRVLVVALGGTAISVALMAALFVPGVDPSRLYYGTDTRAAGLLIGAALAIVWTPELRQTRSRSRSCPTVRGFRQDRAQGRFRRRWRWMAPRLLDALSLAALGTLVFLCLSLGEFDAPLYRGGLATVSLATAALIMALSHPQTRLGSALLGWAPLRWIGERSYGIYLWHWPVFMITRPQLDIPFEGLALLALRLAVTLVLAELSYRFVEMPVRRGALGRAWISLHESRGLKRWDLGVRYAGIVVPAVAVCAVLGMAVGYAEAPETPSYLSTKTVHIEARNLTSEPDKNAEETNSLTGAPANEPESTATEQEAASATRASGKEARARAHGPNTKKRGKAPATDPFDRAPKGTVAAVGDSAMLGAVDVLQQEIPNLTIIDAHGSRQAPEAIGVLRQLRVSGELGDVVIVHIGNNGFFAAEQVDEMMGVLSGVRKVLVVNVTVPDDYSWAPNDEVLADGVRRYPNRAVLVDWYAASAGHPEYFWDGIHLTPQGARAYADLIAAAYEEHGR